MAVPSNTLQNVQTYQKADMAWMLNSFCALNIANKKFENFQNLTANLGDTVTFDLAPRYVSYDGLIITNQPSTQRVQTLVCSQSANVASAFTAQQLIFNVDEYIDRFGMSGAKELGTRIEADILLNAVSGMRSQTTGNFYTDSGPVRFYGDGVTPINSYGQLAQAVSDFVEVGAAKDNMRAILPQLSIPAIINTGLNQFAMTRNNDIAYDWELGRFADTDWYTSNLLPTHTAGTIGNSGNPNNIMTVVSTNDPSGQNITQITFTEPRGATETGAIKSGDMFEFVDGVSGFDNMRALTFIGHKITGASVQFRAIADANSSAGTVTVTLTAQSQNGGLVSAPIATQNINQNIQAGMQVRVIPSHKAGLLMSGNPLYVALPRLPDEPPYPTSSEVDEDSGISIRHYYGALFGQNNRSYVRDAIWGATLVPENCMRICLPV
jgi:hypothetical protein